VSAATLHALALHGTAFVASFAFIAIKAFQQLNVVHHKVWWVVPSSLAMAVCEVWVVANIARYGWGWLVLSIGLGSGLGAVFAMHIHKRIR